MVAKILLLVLATLAALAQPTSGDVVRPQSYTLAGKPTFGVSNRTIYITDCESTSACAIGGGSTVWLFRDSGTAWTAAHPAGGGGSGLTNLNGLTADPQNFVNDTNVTIVSAASNHTLTWSGTLAKGRQNAATVYNDAGNTWSTGAQSFAAATSLTVPTAAGAAPTTNAFFAYDSTAHQFEGGVNGANKIFAMTDGNVATATALQNNPSDCSANQFANTIAANGNLTCAAIADADVPNNITIDLATAAATLQTARNINGVSFNGSADITVTAAAGTLTGATLASGVTASSLTSFGTSPTITTPVIGAYTVAGLPAAGTANRVAIVTDASTAGSCTSGGGAARSWCRDTGAAWEPLGDGTSAGGGITSLEGQTGATQTFTDDTNVTIVSAANAHVITWVGTLAKSRQNAATVYNDAANTYSTGAQDFASATSLKVPTAAGAAPTALGLIAYDSTANAFEGGVNGVNKTFAMTDGNVATATALAANGADCSGSLPRGVDASGAAEGCADADLTTEVTGILPGANGGTGNGFTAFTGPATSLKTFTLPNASATVLTDNALVTVGQGGTGAGTLTGMVRGNGTSAMTAVTSSTVGQVLRVTGADTFAFGAVDLADTDAVTGVLPAGNHPSASTTASGIVELAIDTEVTTGTDATRAVTPDALAGSTIFGTKVVQVEIYPPGTAAATGDGKTYFYVPPALNGMNLVGVSAQVYTAGTTGTLNIDIARCIAAATGNVCSSTVADMLTTNMTIDTGENSTDTAATAAVIDTANDNVATGQVLRFDIDAIHTTPSQGLLVILTFQLP